MTTVSRPTPLSRAPRPEHGAAAALAARAMRVAQTEAARLNALDGYEILDTADEAQFDCLTALAADLFETPIALVSLVDAQRQWFKSRHGLDTVSTDRNMAFCDYAIAGAADSIMVVKDATRDPRFSNNPLVTGPPHIRFYAGAVLTTPDGHNLGTLCVVDGIAHGQPTAAQLKSLKSLAKSVVGELNLHRANRIAQARSQLLELAESMSGVGRWRLDMATGRSIWSPATYAIFGVKRGEVEPGLKYILGLCGAEQRDRLLVEIDAAVAGKHPFEFELQFQRNGETRRVLAKAVRELDERGITRALFGVVQDETDRNSPGPDAEMATASAPRT